MENENAKQLMLDLTLSLAYLCSWEEKTITSEPIHRAWKGYDFDIMDKLKEEGLLDFSYKAKSLCITDEGVQRARELVSRFQKA
ncbi:MAG: hypothetical protein JW973_04440 [Bacteroidales bacterium]|nr:hypothetical protein [Bacteroidales bacterium]